MTNGFYIIIALPLQYTMSYCNVGLLFQLFGELRDENKH